MVETLIAIFLYVMQDKVIFLLFQFALLCILFRAIYHTITARRRTHLQKEVHRGQQSWDGLYLVFGIISAILIWLIDAAQAFEGYKVIVSLADLGTLIYLAFYSDWARNKILGFLQQSRDKKEQH